MALLDDLTGLGRDLTGLSGNDGPVIAQQRPSRMQSLEKKWAPVLPMLQAKGISKSAWGPVFEIDMQRVNRGQTPLSAEESFKAIQAAMTGNTATPVSERNILERVVDDARMVLSSVPKLPQMLAQEVTQLPQAPSVVTKALGEGDIAGALEAPGVRMVPGAYVGATIAKGESPLDHPLMSVLDVLPYASKAASALPKVKAATPELIAQGKLLKARPLRVAASEYIAKPIGETAFGKRWAGKRRNALMGPDVQMIGRMYAQTNRKFTTKDVDQYMAKIEGLREKHDLNPERIEAITTIAERWNTNSVEVQQLPANERAWVEDIRSEIDKLAQEAPEGALTNIDGEWYATKQGAKLGSTKKKIGKNRGKVENVEKLKVELDEYVEWAGKNTEGAYQQLLQEAKAGVSPTLGSIIDDIPDFQTFSNKIDEVGGKAAQEFMDVKLERLRPAILDELDWDYFSGNETWRQPITEIVTINERINGLIKEIKEIDYAKPGANVKLRDKLNKLDKTIYQGGGRMGKSAVKRIEDASVGFSGDMKLNALRDLDTFGKTVRKQAQLMNTVQEYRAWTVGSPRYFNKTENKMKGTSNLANKRDARNQAQAKVDELMTEQEKLVNKEASLESSTIPARFRPLVEDLAREEMRTRMLARGVPEDSIGEVMVRLDEGSIGKDFPLSKQEIAEIRKEVLPMWKELQSKGYDPVFVHGIGGSQVRYTDHMIRADPLKVITPSQFRERTLDPRVSVKNLEVAVKHQGRELIEQEASQELRRRIVDESGFVKKQGDLFEHYRPYAQKVLDRMPEGQGHNIGTITEDLIRNDGWQAWEPSKALPTRAIRGAISEADTIMAPDWLIRTMEQMYPKQKVGIGGALEKVHNVFRMSILPFSPRFHVNNFIGGALMTSFEIGPTNILKHWKAAKEIMKDGALPDEISRGAVVVESADSAIHQAVGRQLAEWWKGEQRQKLGKVWEARDNAAKWSYDLGEKMDTFYRTVSYLEGKTKAERLGLDEAAAKTAGVELANTVLQDWDAMTPVERSVIRMAFPFYGWMKHIVGYTMHLPVDHPWRVGILSNFARNEWEDWGTGIPERFYQMLYFGKTDEWGTIKAQKNPFGQGGFSGAINLRGTNPFSDVANYSTLAGFLGQMSPVASGILEAAGFNSATGRADLYPSTVYDPVLGRNIPKGKNPLQTIAFNVIPQLEPFMAQFGMTTTDMRLLREQNPQAYESNILSAMGIPFVPREINLQREAALAEIARHSDAKNALNEALRSGDWTRANSFPQIRQFLSAMSQVPEGQLKQYMPDPTPKLGR